MSAAGSAEYKEKYVQLKEYRVKTKDLEKKNFSFIKYFPLLCIVLDMYAFFAQRILVHRTNQDALNFYPWHF